MGLGDGGHDLAAVLLGSLALDHDGAVQMLAALGGQVDALLLQRRQHARQHSGSNLHAGIMADAPAADLAAGAADNEDVAGLQMGSFQQFFGGPAGLGRQFRKFYHEINLLKTFYFVGEKYENTSTRFGKIICGPRRSGPGWSARGSTAPAGSWCRSRSPR